MNVSELDGLVIASEVGGKLYTFLRCTDCGSAARLDEDVALDGKVIHARCAAKHTHEEILRVMPLRIWFEDLLRASEPRGFVATVALSVLLDDVEGPA